MRLPTVVSGDPVLVYWPLYPVQVFSMTATSAGAQTARLVTDVPLRYLGYDYQLQSWNAPDSTVGISCSWKLPGITTSKVYLVNSIKGDGTSVHHSQNMYGSVIPMGTTWDWSINPDVGMGTINHYVEVIEDTVNPVSLPKECGIVDWIRGDCIRGDYCA